MDSIERKARELMRARANRICETCAHNSSKGICTVSPDKNTCVYNDFEFWKPDSAAFVKMAERVLAGGRYV